MWESDRFRVRLRVRFVVLWLLGVDWEIVFMGIVCFIFKYVIYEVFMCYWSWSFFFVVFFVYWIEFLWKFGWKNILWCNWNELVCYRIIIVSFCVFESFYCYGFYFFVDLLWFFVVSNECMNGVIYVSLCKLFFIIFILNF